MVSLDRYLVSRDRTVDCALRRAPVPLAECVACGHAERVDPVDPPRFVVCDARYVLGWLGLEGDV